LQGVVTYVSERGWSVIRSDQGARYHCPAKWNLCREDRVEFVEGEPARQGRMPVAHEVQRIVEVQS
jgi:hypothetical protein